LSDKYINNSIKLECVCKLGHKWFAIPNSIKRGTWCPECKKINNRNRFNHSTEEVKKYIENKGGKLLSIEYKNQCQILDLLCDKGHKFQSKFMHLKRGQWCPYCSGRRYTIKDMQEWAKKRNGFCLSNKYINAKTPLKWKCEYGHEWKTTPNNIQQGCWCPYCSKNRVLTN
jgi:hypothetical protein